MPIDDKLREILNRVQTKCLTVESALKNIKKEYSKLMRKKSKTIAQLREELERLGY